ncbi:flavin reductase [Nocardioides sp. Y6]|uniref:Flavin reductase n=1 Tax=Nocardioides malaquae TaxID=2773426 RepID=A0ABR9RNW8_9ACTN|nr:flavin reductase family protein [Nocardioides malaquae]MBE7323264.1 flavin reductase [Nocardioides malaquae]
MTIHAEHPFTGDAPSDEVRRLRARLGGVVTLWTTGGDDTRAGLTVSSVMVARGDEGRVLALVDPLSDFAEEFLRNRRAVVHLLRWSHREVAEVFAGLAPAPGGPFRVEAFEEGPHGPRLLSAGTWAAVELEDTAEVGWSTLVTTRIVELHVDDETDPLVHRRGRYRRAAEVDPPLGE